MVTDAATGKRKGFGFVEMPVYDQAKAAIAALNGKEVYGRNIALSKAEEKEQERPGNFQRQRWEYRNSDGSRNGEIDGNKW